MLLCHEILELQQKKTEDLLMELLRAECHIAYTQKKSYLDSINCYRSSVNRQGALNESNPPSLISRIMDFISTSAQESMEGTPDNSLDGGTIKEMQLSLQVYSDIKHERLVDQISLIVRRNIIADMKDMHLSLGLSKITDDFLSKVMITDPEIHSKISKIQESLDNLKSVLQIIKDVE